MTKPGSAANHRLAWEPGLFEFPDGRLRLWAGQDQRFAFECGEVPGAYPAAGKDLDRVIAFGDGVIFLLVSLEGKDVGGWPGHDHQCAGAGIVLDRNLDNLDLAGDIDRPGRFGF